MMNGAVFILLFWALLFSYMGLMYAVGKICRRFNIDGMLGIKNPARVMRDIGEDGYERPAESDQNRF